MLTQYKRIKNNWSEKKPCRNITSTIVQQKITNRFSKTDTNDARFYDYTSPFLFLMRRLRTILPDAWGESYSQS